MRNIHECMICKAWVIEGFAVNDFIHVAELMNVQEDTTGMTEEKKDNDGKKYHAQVDFFALSPFRTKPKINQFLDQLEYYQDCMFSEHMYIIS